MTAGINDGDDSDSHEEFDRQKAGEWVRAGLARIAPIRVETLRQLNEESRRETEEANAGSRSRPDWPKNGKPADRSNKRAEHTTPTTLGMHTARTGGDSAELVNAGSRLTVRAGPA